MHYKKTFVASLLLGVTISVILNSSNIEANNIINLTFKQQFEQLYKDIAISSGLTTEELEILYAISNTETVYADTKPNIYLDSTVDLFDKPLTINGAEIEYVSAPFVLHEDIDIDTKSEYYVPDVMYSIAKQVSVLKSERLAYNRGNMQIYFDALKDNIKDKIAFYEAVLTYIGEDTENIDNFFSIYEKIIYDKESDENVVLKVGDSISIKPKFIEIINSGSYSKNAKDKLAIMFSYDEDLAVSDNTEELKENYVVPYKLNYTSRENMMVAAASICGKARYVWGGGHSGASYIDGINPVWTKWNDLYLKDGAQGGCIKPSGSWCPIHGFTDAEYHGGAVYSLDEYLELRAEQFDISDLNSDKYKEMLSKVDYSNGINVHTLDGLDCSGFASWLFNQITDTYEVNSTAINFLNQKAFEEIDIHSELLPGDLFTWTSHIVIIVGKVSDSNKVDVTIEETPNVLRYGVLYHTGASSNEIEQAKEIAAQANLLIGGINSEVEPPHCYNMDNIGKYVVENTENQTVTTTHEELRREPAGSNGEDLAAPADWQWYEYNEEEGMFYLCWKENVEQTEEVEVTTSEDKQFNVAGRFVDDFIDEDTIIPEYGKPIKDMYAQEIIQHTISKLPLSYLTGYSEYENDIFDKGNFGLDVDNSEES